MLALCPYSRLVWQGLKDWIGTELQTPLTNNYQKFKIWWNKMMMTQTRNTHNKAQKVVLVKHRREGVGRGWGRGTTAAAD
jgi:hypothetical protein